MLFQRRKQRVENTKEPYFRPTHSLCFFNTPLSSSSFLGFKDVKWLCFFLFFSCVGILEGRNHQRLVNNDLEILPFNSPVLSLRL